MWTGGDMEMSATENIIKDLNIAKFILCNQQMLNPEMCIKIGQAINNAINLIEHEAKPQTVLIRDDGEYCPHCSTSATRVMGVQKLHRGTSVCPYCGGAIKWE